MSNNLFRLLLFFLPIFSLLSPLGAQGFAPRARNEQRPANVERPVQNHPDWHYSNLVRHWEKHGREFPECQTMEDYRRVSMNLFHGAQPGTLCKVQSDGSKLYYHPASNTFGAMALNGVPKTCFRPSARMSYWRRQEGVEHKVTPATQPDARPPQPRAPSGQKRPAPQRPKAP